MTRSTRMARTDPAVRAPTGGPLVQHCGGHACACHETGSIRIGRPDDAREAEADRVADRVLRAVEPAEVTAGDEGAVRRQVANTQELFPPDALKRDEEEERAATTASAVQRKVAGTPGPSPMDLGARLARTATGGRALDPAVRAFMEPRFGHTFADVRIHEDAPTAELCRDLSAHAFTFGRDVYFSAGSFDPSSNDGRRLLAHELAHVVQQRSASPTVARDCQPVPTHTSPGTYCQTEAEAQALVTRACQPDRGDFLYRDGPTDRPWRPIPGYGCAHYVAHRLGITTGRAWENCRSGNSVTIRQLVTGRTANPLASARVNDIWVNSMVHSGVVTSVETDAAGQVSRARVDQCNTQGNVGNISVKSGSFYR